ncbi:MAG: PEMT/PEM2 family methyltransferase [Ignavibacteria bacterium]
MSSYIKLGRKIALILLAMGGILTDKTTPRRMLFLLSLALIYFGFTRLANEITAFESIIIFLLVFLSRYLFLFFSFVENGIAEQLKKRFGEAKGFEIYKVITALMFFLSGSSFSLMIYKSKILIPLYNYFGSLFVAAGIIAVLTGMIVNVWSTLVVGIDVYYYKDLFLGKAVVDFKKEGPYSIFSNPMYGMGQANGYGYALIHGSAAGIAFIFLNQLMMYLFYLTIEKPHIKRLFAKNRNANNYSVKKKILITERLNE